LDRQEFEIVVADNASPLSSDALADAIAGRARLIVVEERGAGPARNGAVGVAAGAILAFTDADCLPEPNWLSEGVKALQDYDVVGGGMKVLVEDERALTPVEAFERVFAFDNGGYVEKKGFSVTANLFCSARVFQRVGGFKVGVPEDLEWCHRATASGHSLGYAPGAVVGHPARRTWNELKGKWQRLNHESYGHHRTRSLGSIRWLARTWLLPLSALFHAPRILFSRRISSPALRVATVGLLFRLRLWRFFDAHRLLLGKA
jgi:GT2 family glycosyltransferase